MTHDTHPWARSCFRLKDVAQKQYSQKEADMAAGKSIEKYTPAHAPADAAMDADL